MERKAGLLFWQAACFAVTIFTSAFLLFQIQPLVSKRILPWFGGSPAVWTTCLLFFQVVLLAGYAYAHLGTAWLRPKYFAAVHMTLVVAAALTLAVLPSQPSVVSPTHDPVADILLILAGSIGLPYFALSASGPLLQVWFAQVFPGRIPYRLYALSNLGSLAALLSYPILVEPRWDLPQQARLWAGGFSAFTILTGIAALLWIRRPSSQATTDTGQTATPPRRFDLLTWLLWPACAAVTLMATTNHVCTDVASVPFLWVVPLALYLLTFIIAFDHPRWHQPVFTAACTLVAVYGSALASQKGVGWLDLYDCGMTGRSARLVAELLEHNAENGGTTSPPLGPQVYIGFLAYLAVNFAAMFGICLLCHGEVARRRPDPRFLTWFYLMLAVGGALGGVAVALVAPHAFATVVEWKLAMFVAAIATIAAVLQWLVNRVAGSAALSVSAARAALASRLTLVALLLPVSFILLDVVEYLYTPKKDVLWEQRNFFGALTVRERNSDDPKRHNFVLLHGVTVHGSQFAQPERRGQPTTYYSTVSGVGRTLNFFRSRPPQGPLRIGDVGLGVGTLAAYAGKGDLIRFYEIDPDVVELADGNRWFSYLADCRARGAGCDVQLGDGRLTLQRERSESEPIRFHVLVLDAFSGDAVPVHLLTVEAFEMYASCLTTAAVDGEDGAIAVNISNRYLDLEPVVRGAAERIGLAPLCIRSPQVSDQAIDSAAWVVVSRNAALLRELAPFARAGDEPSKPAVVWTDAHSSLFDALE